MGIVDPCRKADPPFVLRWVLFWLLLFAGVVLCFSPGARSDDSYTVTVKKSPDSKDIRKWSLAEFLDTKDRMRLMDLWLALHTPKPYEFFLDANSRFVDTNAVAFPHDSHFGFFAFASIFGLAVEVDTIPSRINYSFNVRLFGFREQATHLTVHVGIRNQWNPVSFRSAFLGGNTNLYFSRHFGLEGMIRHYYAGTSDATDSLGGRNFEGDHFEGNAFIDFSSLRIYGGYLNERDDFLTRIGYQVGLRIFL